MEYRKLLMAVLLLLAVLSPAADADKRTENIDVIVALDKSLSMEHKIGAVKDWVNSYLIEQVLIANDYFIVVAFYGKTDLIISQFVKDDADKKALKKTIAGARGNGRFTDIGNALDVLRAQIQTREQDGRQKYVLLLTDGIQEAPPTSKYWSKDGTFNHEFLSNTKTIQEKGWKIMILGIGAETAAKDLARELQSSYSEITETLTIGNLTEKTSELFGISLKGPVSVRPVSSNGRSELFFTLASSGLKADTEIAIQNIAARLGQEPAADLLSAPHRFMVKSGTDTAVRIPVRFPPSLPPGPSTGTLTFSFLSSETFAPAEVPVTVSVKTWLQNSLWLVAAAAAVLLLLIVLAILLVRRLARGKPLRFAVVIADEPVGGGPVTLAPGHELFLNETGGSFSLIRKRNARSIACFAVKDRKLSFSILKSDRFPKVKEIPPDARGRTFSLRSERGEILAMKIQSKERAK